MSQKSQDIINAILDQRKANADLKDLSAAFLTKWNGVDGIMKELKVVYDNSVTAADKTKILLAGIDLVKQVSANGGASDEKFDDLTDDEMRAVMKEAMTCPTSSR